MIVTLVECWCPDNNFNHERDQLYIKGLGFYLDNEVDNLFWISKPNASRRARNRHTNINHHTLNAFFLTLKSSKDDG